MPLICINRGRSTDVISTDPGIIHAGICEDELGILLTEEKQYRSEALRLAREAFLNEYGNALNDAYDSNPTYFRGCIISTINSGFQVIHFAYQFVNGNWKEIASVVRTVKDRPEYEKPNENVLRVLELAHSFKGGRYKDLEVYGKDEYHKEHPFPTGGVVSTFPGLNLDTKSPQYKSIESWFRSILPAWHCPATLHMSGIKTSRGGSGTGADELRKAIGVALWNGQAGHAWGRYTHDIREHFRHHEPESLPLVDLMLAGVEQSLQTLPEAVRLKFPYATAARITYDPAFVKAMEQRQILAGQISTYQAKLSTLDQGSAEYRFLTHEIGRCFEGLSRSFDKFGIA